MPVPASYNDIYPDAALRDHVGDAWYQTVVRVPRGWDGQRVVLRFDAATHRAVVWVDDVEVGRHEGGYTPFEADVTPHVRPGEEVTFPSPGVSASYRAVWEVGGVTATPVGRVRFRRVRPGRVQAEVDLRTEGRNPWRLRRTMWFRQSAGERLREREQIRLDAEMLVGEELSRPTEATLDLNENECHLSLTRQRAKLANTTDVEHTASIE